MTTFEIIRHRSGFANVPDSFHVHDGGFVDEFTSEVATYILPDGYRVGLDARNEMSIIRRDCVCEIVMHASGSLHLAHWNQRGYISPPLQRA